jgi:hypothetical protein
MNPLAHLEIYRVAFESANSELIEITEEYERLRVRMDQIERLITALKPLVFEQENEILLSREEDPTADRIETAVSVAPDPSPAEPVRVGYDPFQHRINHVLGIGAGIRDVRSYTRQF